MALTKEQLALYFQRIGYEGTPDRTSATLGAIQEAHLNHIPYENLDLTRGVPLSLEEGDLFEKLVTRRRGGYCFEQNGLLFSASPAWAFLSPSIAAGLSTGSPRLSRSAATGCSG